jgi:uncharacterized protein
MSTEKNPARYRFTRRRFLQALLAAGAAGTLGVGYTFRAEPRWLKISERHVPLSPAYSGSPFRILHLSDLHASDEVPLEQIARAIEAGLALRPDAACITGDFITRREKIPPGYAAVLQRLADAVPTFGCLGNHDGGIWTARYGGTSSSAEVRLILATAGVRCLHNQSAHIMVHGTPLEFVGLGDLWSNECLPRHAFSKVTASQGRPPRIVLNHNPDAKDMLRAYDWDLMLSGHTHGGQIGLPFFREHFAPVQDKRFLEGLHHWQDRWLHVSRGVGNLMGARFLCRPEITLLTLA